MNQACIIIHVQAFVWKEVLSSLSLSFFFFVQSSTIHKWQDMEATSMSTDRWLDREDVEHVYDRILLSYRKE